MMLPNHLVGGIGITAAIMGLRGENIFATKVHIICTIVCAVLPDIDNPKSPVSWLCRPLSIYLSRHYGHRTITHSLGALIGVCCVAFGLGYLGTGVSWLVCGMAYFSHLLLDMATFMGVPLLYPLKGDWFISPNRRYRIQTGNYGTEAAFFGLFCLLTSFSMPLAEKGFWTVYNTSFGTPKTLHSEFVRSPDLMTATCVWQLGSDIRTDTGFVVSVASEAVFTLWRNDSFIRFDAMKQIIKSVVPTHTKRPFYIETLPFINLDADSLNALIRPKIVLDIQADANEPFRFFENGLPQRSLSAKLSFPHRLFFQSLDSLPKKDSLFQEVDFASMSIRNDLKRLDEEYKHRCAEFKRHADSLTIYSNWAATEKDFVTKERYQKRRDQLRLEEKPQFDYVAQNDLNAQLQIAIARFAVDNQRRLFEREKAFMATLRAKPKTTFVGVIKWLRFE